MQKPVSESKSKDPGEMTKAEIKRTIDIIQAQSPNLSAKWNRDCRQEAIKMLSKDQEPEPEHKTKKTKEIL